MDPDDEKLRARLSREEQEVRRLQLQREIEPEADRQTKAAWKTLRDWFVRISLARQPDVETLGCCYNGPEPMGAEWWTTIFSWTLGEHQCIAVYTSRRETPELGKLRIYIRVRPGTPDGETRTFRLVWPYEEAKELTGTFVSVRTAPTLTEYCGPGITPPLPYGGSHLNDQSIKYGGRRTLSRNR